MTEWDIVKVIIELLGLAVIVARAVKSFGDRMAEVKESMTELKISNKELEVTISGLTGEFKENKQSTAESFAKVFVKLSENDEKFNEINERLLRLELDKTE